MAIKTNVLPVPKPAATNPVDVDSLATPTPTPLDTVPPTDGEESASSLNLPDGEGTAASASKPTLDASWARADATAQTEVVTPTKADELVLRDSFQPNGNTIKLPEGVELTPTGIKWPKGRGLTPVEWQTIGAALTYIKERCGWWVLDWWVYGEKKYGDLTKLATAIGCKPKTLHNKASVARQVPPSRRREDLAVSIHAEVAALKPADQVKWLNAAEKHKLTKQALRESIKRGKVIRGAKGKGGYLGVSDILDTRDRDGNVVLGPAAAALAALLKRLPQLPLQNCEDARTLRLWIERLEPFVNLQSVCREQLLAVGEPIEPPAAEPTGTATTTSNFDPAARYVAPEGQV
jgi:hypothetical protein